jgi:hypothetical protein
MMMSVAKKIGRATWLAAPTARFWVSSSSGMRSRRRSSASVTTMAPSTMTPKSMAPSENRFAGMWNRVISTKTVASATGMVAATISDTRALPRNRNRITHTRTTPSAMVWPTFSTVAWTRLSRSM